MSIYIILYFIAIFNAYFKFFLWRQSMKSSIFSGACTALITPFREGEIDYAALKKLIEFQISSGIDALLVNGTTGESATLSDSEKKELIAFAVREVGGRVPLIAGTGSNDTKKAIELSEFAADAGADAVLVVTPYYNKASASGLARHYTAIADACTVPLILYNVPSRTGVNIPRPVLRSLSEHENIVAIKEASANVSYAAHIVEDCRDKLDLYSGNDDLTLPLLSLGGLGVISVLSNALPREVSELCRLWFDGKVKEASALALKLLPLTDAIFSEVNPIPIKALLAYLDFCCEEYRLPLSPMEECKKEALINEFEKFKL